MNGYTIAELRNYLMAVRGETRVKDKEEPIRNTFLHEAVNEVFAEYDWNFNKRSVEIEADEEGSFSVPNDFSVLNNYWVTGTDGKTYTKDDFEVSMTKGKISLIGPVLIAGTLHYYIKAPNLVSTTGEVRAYFPQPMLLAERAYVRLKIAYFPDEDNEKELSRSRVAVRDLFTSTLGKRSFTHRWQG